MTTSTIANAVNAYANAAKNATLGDTATPAGGGFGDMLKQAADSAIGTMEKGESVSIQAATGKADINDVVLAMSNAEVTLQTVTAIRDKVISAYQDVLRMAI
jgi:flagellar hook-basal body complex protein FliE